LVDGCSDGERNRGASVPHFHCNLTNVSKMTYMDAATVKEIGAHLCLTFTVI